MKICSLYGAGFYYMPGTDTCIKIGGFVRSELNFNSLGSFNAYHVQNLDSPAKNFTVWRSRAVLTVDARSQTEYGTLRSYIAFGPTWDNGSGSLAGAPGGATIYAYRGFIQWAGFTVGRAQSFFDFYSTPAYSNTFNIWSSDTGGGGMNVAGYTAQFGNGFSATLSIEDGAHRRNGNAANTVATIIGPGATSYGGVEWPDFVANLRIDQSWGSAQIMGALHQVNSINPAGTNGPDEIGWAVGAGLTLNLPMIGRGDTFSMQATYAEGALSYVGSGLGAGAGFGGLPGLTIQQGCGVVAGTLCATGVTDNAVGVVADAVRVGGNLELTTGWSVAAGFQHVWNPKWKTSLYGTYGEINYDTFGPLLDWSMWQIGSRTVWTPVTNLDLSVDIMYNKLDGGAIGAAPGVNTDVGWLQGMVRAQRNFYP